MTTKDQISPFGQRQRLRRPTASPSERALSRPARSSRAVSRHRQGGHSGARRQRLDAEATCRRNRHDGHRYLARRERPPSDQPGDADEARLRPRHRIRRWFSLGNEAPDRRQGLRRAIPAGAIDRSARPVSPRERRGGILPRVRRPDGPGPHRRSRSRRRPRRRRAVRLDGLRFRADVARVMQSVAFRILEGAR